MTAQISDTFIYQEKEFSIVAIANEWPFSPEKEGLKPVVLHTACWRGFYCRYSLLNNTLILKQLNIALEDPQPPLWKNSVLPVKSNDQSWEYQELNLLVEYSGGIIIGRDFLQEFYVHMGFHQPHCYQKVHELTFEKGKLTNQMDNSSQMEEVRKKIKRTPETSDSDPNEIKKFIKSAFSLSYQDKWF